MLYSGCQCRSEPGLRKGSTPVLYWLQNRSAEFLHLRVHFPGVSGRAEKRECLQRVCSFANSDSTEVDGKGGLQYIWRQYRPCQECRSEERRVGNSSNVRI